MSSISLPPTLMPPRGYLAVIRTIDKFTEWTGYLFILFIIPLILANVIEVVARYVFKDPTIWALDVTTMSYAALFMLGSALALLFFWPWGSGAPGANPRRTTPRGSNGGLTHWSSGSTGWTS